MNMYIYIGLATIVIAAFALFWVFHSMETFATNCKADPNYSTVCDKFSGFTASMLIILLIVGGFVVTITATAYIMLSSG